MQQKDETVKESRSAAENGIKILQKKQEQMDMNPYIGHESQVYRIEEHRLIGGKGDGMRLLEIANGCGLEMTISPDRCADISRLTFRGSSLSYFSPSGYVAPPYYDDTRDRWLNSFTAGFLTTCGLRGVGSSCVDEGEEVPLHGTIANIPSEHVYWFREGKELMIRADIKDEVIFGSKLSLFREYRVRIDENTFVIKDVIENTGDTEQPLEILYHMNMGYPLLDEDSVVHIPSCEVTPRDAHAAEDLANWMRMEKPQAGYVERCYYHKFSNEKGKASIWQPKLHLGLEMAFDAKKLDGFVEWKMMGIRDYVLGLECGNCYPDGRDVMRKTGMLKFIRPGERVSYQVTVRMLEENPGDA